MKFLSKQSGLELGASLSRSKSRKDGLPLEEPRSLSRRFSGDVTEYLKIGFCCSTENVYIMLYINIHFCVNAGQLSFIEPETKDHYLPTLKSPVRKSPSVKKTPTFAMNLREDHARQSEDSGEKHERQRKPVSEPMRIQPPLRTRSERRAPPPPPPPPPSPPPLRLPPREIKRQNSGPTSRKDDTTADAWEKAELAKISAR